MAEESLSFVMVGHIDHGKSTLIGRLLYDTGSLPEGKIQEIEAAARAEGKRLEYGFIMDHLHEERERGITIDTAQTFFSTAARDYVIIDAPGHKEFIKNMITGASQAEAAVLLCSVAEGVQEQTKRHAYVIRLLGLEQVTVAYNKMDLVDYDRERFESVRRDMNDWLERLGVRATMEVPLSAHVGDNVATRSERMPWYEGPTLVEALDRFRKIPPATRKPLRFPVQDVYEHEGERVAVGRVESGRLHKDRKIRFLPGGDVRTVREVLQFMRPDMAEAVAGECVALRLDGKAPERGQVGCPEDDQAGMTRRLRASVFWLAPEPLQMDDGAQDLALRCATQETPCRLVELAERVDSGNLAHLPTDERRLCETEVGEMVIETDSPVVVESFYNVPELGRFVLVKGRNVVAGGIVTHTDG
ncbi:MAG: elongation factor Tu [Candidatus Brocadiaceae bacterium]|nr:elongation factor Tu [Candidatus Brocadiaceae bacterium]